MSSFQHAVSQLTDIPLQHYHRHHLENRARLSPDNPPCHPLPSITLLQNVHSSP